MNPVNPTLHTSLALLALSLGWSASACRSAAQPAVFDQTPYGALATPGGLRLQFDQDFERFGAAAAMQGIEQFVLTHIDAKQATWASLVYEDLELVTRLQLEGAGAYVRDATEYGKLLQRAANKEMEDAYTAAEVGDWNALRKLRDPAKSAFHPETVALSPTMKPHSALLEALMAFEESADAPQDSAGMESMLERLAAARDRLAYSRHPRAQFLAGLATARALESAGRIEEAGEYWLMLMDSEDFEGAPPALKQSIAVRTATYTRMLNDRLAVAQEGERRAEIQRLHQRYEQQLGRVSAKVSNYEALVRSNQAAVQAELRALYETDQRFRRDIDALMTQRGETRTDAVLDSVARGAISGATDFVVNKLLKSFSRPKRKPSL